MQQQRHINMQTAETYKHANSRGTYTCKQQRHINMKTAETHKHANSRGT